MEEQTVRHQHSEPAPELRIKVEKGQRNSYAWEISASVAGHDVDELLRVIDEADTKLWNRYGEVGPRAA